MKQFEAVADFTFDRSQADYGATNQSFVRCWTLCSSQSSWSAPDRMVIAGLNVDPLCPPIALERAFAVMTLVIVAASSFILHVPV